MYNIKNSIAKIQLKDYIQKYRDADRVWGYCKACNRYNACWACPPFSYDTTAIFDKYKYAYIIASQIIFDDSTRLIKRNNEEMKYFVGSILDKFRNDMDWRLLSLEKEFDSLALFAGTCLLCPHGECTKLKGAPCIHPDKIRPSLEAIGFDIMQTNQDLLGIELKWSVDDYLPEYYTMTSAIFSNKNIETHILLSKI